MPRAFQTPDARQPTNAICQHITGPCSERNTGPTLAGVAGAEGMGERESYVGHWYYRAMNSRVSVMCMTGE